MDGVVDNPEVELKRKGYDKMTINTDFRMNGKYLGMNGKRIFNQQRKKEVK